MNKATRVDLQNLCDFLIQSNQDRSSFMACAGGSAVCVPQFNMTSALQHSTKYGVQSMRWQDVHREMLCSSKPIIFDSYTVGRILSEALK